MKKHTKVYLKYFDYGLEDFIPCTACGKRAVDIHHIKPRGLGGSKSKDFIANLVALCRECHTKAESSKKFNEYVKEKHLKLL